jgi:hypothetical protein
MYAVPGFNGLTHEYGRSSGDEQCADGAAALSGEDEDWAGEGYRKAEGSSGTSGGSEEADELAQPAGHGLRQA